MPGDAGALRAGFAVLPDSRRGQGRKHRLETVQSLDALARLAGLAGPVAIAQFAAGLGQCELRALGAWTDPATGRRVPPSAATVCRVLADTDPDALQEVLVQWAAPRLATAGATPALAPSGRPSRDAAGTRSGAGAP